MTARVIRTGLIGEHISQTSFGLAMEMMCNLAGLRFVFDRIDSAAQSSFDFSAAVDDLRARGWTGTAVTHPFKADAAHYAGDGMSAEARPLGAANSLRFGKIVEGFNTDHSGFLSAWQHEMAGRPVGKVALAGAGGVARAIAPALARLGADEILIWDVELGRSEALARLTGPIAEAIPAEAAREAVLRADGLANCSPVGMAHMQGSAFPADTIGGQTWAFDAIYMPLKTEFLETCRNKRLATLSGFDFFRHMILDSFEIFTGIVADRAEMMPRLEALKPA